MELSVYYKRLFRKENLVDLLEINFQLPLNWSIDGVSSNSNILLEDILHYSNELWWHWDDICSNKNITFEQMVKFMNKTIHWEIRSQDTPVSLENILKYKVPLEYINWKSLSFTEEITNILKNPKIPWDWKVISLRHEIPVEYIFNTPRLLWSRHAFLSDGILQ